VDLIAIWNFKMQKFAFVAKKFLFKKRLKLDERFLEPNAIVFFVPEKLLLKVLEKVFCDS